MTSSPRSRRVVSAIVRATARPVVWVPLSAALLGLVVLGARPWDATPYLAAADPAPAVAAIAFNGAVVVLWGIRSARLLTVAGAATGLGAATRLAAMAYAVNAVTPGSTGELVRAVALKGQHRVPYPVGAAVILVERFGALYLLTASAGLAWLGGTLDVPVPVLVGGWAAIGLSPLLIRVVPVRPGAVIRGVARALGSRGPAAAVAGSQDLDAAFLAMVGSGRSAIAFGLTSAGLFAIFALQLVLVGSMLGIPIEPIHAWAAVGLAMTAGVLSLLPFGLGATDVALVGLLVTGGLAPPEASIAALAYRLVTTLPLGLVGAVAYARTIATRPLEPAAR